MSRELNEGLEDQTTEVRVRLATLGDKESLRRLLELNGMPRRLAAERSFLITVQGEKVLGALEYRGSSREAYA